MAALPNSDAQRVTWACIPILVHKIMLIILQLNRTTTIKRISRNNFQIMEIPNLTLICQYNNCSSLLNFYWNNYKIHIFLSKNVFYYISKLKDVLIIINYFKAVLIDLIWSLSNTNSSILIVRINKLIVNIPH